MLEIEKNIQIDLLAVCSSSLSGCHQVVLGTECQVMLMYAVFPLLKLTYDILYVELATCRVL